MGQKPDKVKAEKKKEKRVGKKDDEGANEPEDESSKLANEFDQILSDPVALLCFKPIGKVSEAITLILGE